LGLAFGYTYIMSITCAHELSHAAVAGLTGHTTSMHISPYLWGGKNYVLHSCPQYTFNSVFISLAGPLGGIAASLAWSPLLQLFLQCATTKDNKKEEWKFLFEKRFGIVVSFIGAINELWTNLIPGYATFGPPNDGLQIQRSLTILAPSLAKAYPFIIYTSLAGLIGCGVYSLFYATHKAKNQADLS
jgi:hypothetical protein